MKRILIYNDEGVTEFSVTQLRRCFEKLFPALEIIDINGENVRNGILFKPEESQNETLLCIGGGFDLGYLKSLQSEGCEQIREFVLTGGNYLGICAGAYFACESILFDGPDIVQGERPLRFFPGQAIGPVNRQFIYDSDDKAVAIEIRLDNNSRTYTYLNGGCYFEPNNSENQFDQIACYSHSTNGEQDELLSVDNKLAIVECKVGLGKCLLSGVHFEFNAHDLDRENENIRTNVYPMLINQDSPSHSNEQLVRRLISRTFQF